MEELLGIIESTAEVLVWIVDKLKWILLLLVVLVVAAVCLNYATSDHRAECEAKGGKYTTVGDGYKRECVQKIPLNP